MKSWLVLLVVVAACSSDNPSGGPDASTPAPDASGPDGAPGATPVIVKIAWTPPAGCVAGTPGLFTLTFDVTDADTPTGMLTIAGVVPHCTPTTFSSSPATFTCPDFLPYTDNTLTVADPQGHSAMMTFTMSPCQAGMVP